MGNVLSVNISEHKGEQKRSVSEVVLKRNHGIIGDAHAADWHRQISLLASESIDKLRNLGLDFDSGDFAENITTTGIDLVSIPLGTRLKIGEAEVEVTQIGKECHNRCKIFYQVGDCVMPKEGIFVIVTTEGKVIPGDEISLIQSVLD